MFRTDGYRVRGKDAMYELVPYIMPYRYDASNSVTVDIDLGLMQDYVRKCRKKGINMSHMSIIIAGALRIASQNPFKPFTMSFQFFPKPFSQPLRHEQENLRKKSFLRILCNPAAWQNKRYCKQNLF